MGFSVLLRVLSCAMCVLVLVHVVQSQCEDYKSETMVACSLLFQRFQSALVGSEVNLYNLRKTFSPASHPAPILVNVSYEISIGDVSDDLCPGVDNDSTLFNTSEVQYLNYGWTSSVLYTYYHPAELNRLQPQLVFQILESLEFEPELDGKPVATAFTWDGRDSITTAQLFLTISSLPCSPSYEEVYNTLQDITSLLKIYTETQTNLTTWNTKDAGYVLNGSAFSTDSSTWGSGNHTLNFLYIFSFVISFFLASFFTVFTTYVITKKAPKNSETNDFKMLHSLFWTSIGVLVQFNFVLLLAELSFVIIWCTSLTSCSAAGHLKLAWIMAAVFYAIWGAIASVSDFSIVKKYINFQSLPFFEVGMEKVPLLCPPVISFFFFLCFHTRSLTKGFFKFILVSTLFVSSSLLFFYTLPVLVLLIVYPIKIAAAYTFLTAALVLYILIAFYGEYKRVLLPEYKLNNGLYILYLFCLPILNVMLIFVIIFLYITVYKVLSSGFTENPVLQALLSFFPSLILSSFIWVFKHRFQISLMEQSSEEYGTSGVETDSQMDRQWEHREQEHPETEL